MTIFKIRPGSPCAVADVVSRMKAIDFDLEMVQMVISFSYLDFCFYFEFPCRSNRLSVACQLELMQRLHLPLRFSVLVNWKTCSAKLLAACSRPLNAQQGQGRVVDVASLISCLAYSSSQSM